MALPDRYSIDKKINSLEGLSAYENGGAGSGNFGHSGRPGEVGGSASTGSGSSSSASEGKRMPLSSFMKLAKTTPLELRQTSFHGGEPANPDWRSVGKVQTTGMYLDGSYLDLPKSSLTEVEWDDEKGVGKLKCYDAGFRDYNEGEKAALAEWKKITDTPEYKQRAEIDALTDGGSTYWQEKSFWADRGMEYMFHTKKGGKIRSQNPNKKDKDGHYVWEIQDDSVKGRLWGEYEIRRKDGKNNSLEDVIANAVVKALNGGKGSGNFGHSGRPGEVGGSGDGKGDGESHATAKQTELDEIEKSGGTVYRGKGDVYELFKDGVDTVTMTKKDALKIAGDDANYHSRTGQQNDWLEIRGQRAVDKIEKISDDSLVDMVLHNPQSDTEYPKYRVHKKGN